MHVKIFIIRLLLLEFVLFHSPFLVELKCENMPMPRRLSSTINGNKGNTIIDSNSNIAIVVVAVFLVRFHCCCHCYSLATQLFALSVSSDHIRFLFRRISFWFLPLLLRNHLHQHLLFWHQVCCCGGGGGGVLASFDFMLFVQVFCFFQSHLKA